MIFFSIALLCARTLVVSCEQSGKYLDIWLSIVSVFRYNMFEDVTDTWWTGSTKILVTKMTMLLQTRVNIFLHIEGHKKSSFPFPIVYPSL